MQGEFPKKFTALVVGRSSKVPLTEGKGPDSTATLATKGSHRARKVKFLAVQDSSIGDLVTDSLTE